MMLKMPRAVDRKARDVGTHEWKAEEKLMRYWLVGVQCSGRLVPAPGRDDRGIAAFGLFRAGAENGLGPCACCYIRGSGAVKRCLLGMVI